jgi:hypothetical protein
MIKYKEIEESMELTRSDYIFLKGNEILDCCVEHVIPDGWAMAPHGVDRLREFILRFFCTLLLIGEIILIRGFS